MQRYTKSSIKPISFILSNYRHLPTHTKFYWHIQSFTEIHKVLLRYTTYSVSAQGLLDGDIDYWFSDHYDVSILIIAKPLIRRLNRRGRQKELLESLEGLLYVTIHWRKGSILTLKLEEKWEEKTKGGEE